MGYFTTQLWVQAGLLYVKIDHPDPFLSNKLQAIVQPVGKNQCFIPFIVDNRPSGR